MAMTRRSLLTGPRPCGLGQEVAQPRQRSAVFRVDLADLADLEAALASYLDGLRDAGWRGDERPPRLGYLIDTALRHSVLPYGLVEPNEAFRPCGAGHRRAHLEEMLTTSSNRAASCRPGRHGAGAAGGDGVSQCLVWTRRPAEDRRSQATKTTMVEHATMPMTILRPPSYSSATVMHGAPTGPTTRPRH
jgi:hypothetical protein